MGISKAWLQDKINESNSKMEQNQNNLAQFTFHKGATEAYTDCYNELTKAPSLSKPLKKVDHDKAFEEIVKYYVDKKGYTVEHATQIAIKAIGEQKQKVLEQAP